MGSVRGRGRRVSWGDVRHLKIRGLVPLWSLRFLGMGLKKKLCPGKGEEDLLHEVMSCLVNG